MKLYPTVPAGYKPLGHTLRQSRSSSGMRRSGISRWRGPW